MIYRPILGITIGDLAGIGPEIAVKALNREEVYRQCKPLLVGNVHAVKREIDRLNLKLKLNKVHTVKEAVFEYGTIDVYSVSEDIDVITIEYGKLNKEAGRAAFEAVDKVIELAMNKEIDGTVTGPLNKEALNLAGYHYNGHTEIYAEKTNTDRYAMMLANEDVRVVHVSTHVSLREACDRVKEDRVYEVIHIAQDACQSLGIKEPRIGVAGLNPHSGEGGLFGTEEIEEIIPAIEKAQSEGLNVDGPVAADTIYSKAIGGVYDIVVAMYHDQGHIPMKVIGFQMDKETGMWKDVNGVNVTLGLPIIRSSVEHGTAFDQAGKGTASTASLMSAIQYGKELAVAKKEKTTSFQ